MHSTTVTNDPVQDQWSMCAKVVIATLTAGFFLHLASEKALVDDEPKADFAVATYGHGSITSRCLGK